MSHFAIRVSRAGWLVPRYVTTNANVISTDIRDAWPFSERYLAETVAAQKREKFAKTKQSDMVFEVVEAR